jgi:hypothetical protein
MFASSFPNKLLSMIRSHKGEVRRKQVRSHKNPNLRNQKGFKLVPIVYLNKSAGIKTE